MMRTIGSRENLRLLLILAGDVLGLLSIYTVMVNSVSHTFFCLNARRSVSKPKGKHRADGSHVPLRIFL